MNDNKPLFSEKHKTFDGWGFKIPFIGKRLNNFLDNIWLLIHRPKLTKSNIKNYEKTNNS
jgi:hypothetical protein